MRTILTNCYALIINLRNWLYDKKLLKIVKPSIPVISVGNITVGGTGKTPMVILLARLLLSIGFKPAIIGKGYKRKSKGKVIVRDEKNIKSKLQDSGDEMMMVARKVRTPVLVHNSKSVAAIAAEKEFAVDSIIVDDGFQHRKLHRDLDIVILDELTLGEVSLLPKGRLRERIANINRADVICLVGKINLNKHQMEYLKNSKLFIRVKGHFHKPYLLGTKNFTFDFNSPDFKNDFCVVTAIANPDRFLRMLTQKGIQVSNTFCFDDHHNYTLTDIKKINDALITSNKNLIATTEKDAVKLIKFRKEFSRNNIKVIIFPYYFRIVQGGKAFINLLKSKYKK